MFSGITSSLAFDLNISSMSIVPFVYGDEGFISSSNSILSLCLILMSARSFSSSTAFLSRMGSGTLVAFKKSFVSSAILLICSNLSSQFCQSTFFFPSSNSVMGFSGTNSSSFSGVLISLGF